MSAGHAHPVYRSGETPIHRLPPHGKLAAAVLFVLIVVATPREQYWAFGAYAALLVGLLAVARLPPPFVLRRMLIEVPFILFALFLPLVARGEREIVLAGVGLSVAGLLAAWNVLAKATLGVVTAVLLAATTQPRDLLLGAQRLRVPPPLIQIATFMLRYLDVIAGDLRRMRTALLARGFDPRGPRQWPALARTAGSLFLRSYERGERVYLAMLSRGYTGSMPTLADVRATRGQVAAAAALPTVALAIMITARVGAL